jgi:hypothetical protein
MDALKQSTPYDNVVLEKAEELIEKGYRQEEVAGVLERLAEGLIDADERTIVSEAYEEITVED